MFGAIPLPALFRAGSCVYDLSHLSSFNIPKVFHLAAPWEIHHVQTEPQCNLNTSLGSLNDPEDFK
jgi:hypothetical protein